MRIVTIALASVVAAAAFAPVPDSTLPWKRSLKEARDEAKLRNIPIVLYLGKDGIPT
ncbi:MAG: hypothetical protein HY286_16080 [Planctomycetes bacterium]|nr:hypothetical protein [Planctomycetota bacterium]